MKTCFVIMSFDERYDKVYHQAIKPAVGTCEYKCMRADSSNAPANIISEIVREIINADVVIADISDRSPNVFYELGISHSIGNKTITITSRDHGDLPFDISPFRVIQYASDEASQLELLKYRLTEEIKKLQTEVPNNPVQEAGREFFDQRSKVSAAIDALATQLERAKKNTDLWEQRKQNKLNDNTQCADAIVDAIAKFPRRGTTPLFVCICGPGAIGKSTFSLLIMERMGDLHKPTYSIDRLPTDSYMLSRAERIRRNITGFQPESHDLEQMMKDVGSLRQNSSVTVTPYDHATGTHGQEVTVQSTDVIILEGIYSFYPELTEMNMLRYYIFADQHTAKELKFIADLSERGHDVQTAYIHGEVEYRTYETHILPYIRIADAVIMVDGYWHYQKPRESSPLLRGKVPGWRTK